MPESTISQGLENIILTALALIVIVVFLGSFYSFIVAIFKFVFSRGDTEKIKQARNSIRYMIIWLLLSLILLFLFPIVFQYMNITGYSMYTARNIFHRAGELIQWSWSTAFTIKRDFQRFQDGEYIESPSNAVVVTEL